VEFSSGSVINRNKIKTGGGWTWLTVPTSDSSGDLIKDVQIATGDRWQEAHEKSIRVHYSNADHYVDLNGILDVYDQPLESLCELNILLVRRITDVLNLDIEFVRSSDLDASGAKTELLVDICERVEADEYFSGAGAKDYQDDSLFAEKNIELQYQSFEYPEYEQLFEEFIQNLSIVDMLANTGAERTRTLLKEA
jgi:hypothetical protein